jgi:DNA-binding transcriptional MerR regulator
MLRHYDAIGLLRPAHVDQSSGYRFYEAAQLSRLNRIVALKGLGFTLQQVQTILDEDISTEELRGMLRLRRAELEAALAEAALGLAQVEARLRSIGTGVRTGGPGTSRDRVRPLRRPAPRRRPAAAPRWPA